MRSIIEGTDERRREKDKEKEKDEKNDRRGSEWENQSSLRSEIDFE